MTEARGGLFTIPVGVPFLDALARAILAGHLPRPDGQPPSPLDLTRYTLYLPTRRACRAMREAFLAASATPGAEGCRATLLPRIRALGDVDEEALLLSAPSGEEGSSGGQTPPCIAPAARIMVLSRMVLSWVQGLRRGRLWASSPTDLFAKATPANAIDLAFELARLADQTQIEGCSLSGLQDLAPERYSDHWRLTLDFLRIVAEQWPLYLGSAGVIDPMQRRNILLQLEAERLAAAGRTAGAGARFAPVIVAGVTASAPASLGLMRAVLASGQGAIVLPGLDRDLDEASWLALTPHHPEHPQYALKRLLDRLGAARDDVGVPPGAEPTREALARHAFFSEALRPAGASNLWRRYIDSADRNGVRKALEQVSLIAAPSVQDEARIIAFLLREAAETPGKTASLVTPDRALARRVAALLLKWGIAIDDSGGAPLAHSRQGSFLDLIASAAQNGSPDTFLSLLKHPLARLGLPRPELRARSRTLEMLAMRQPWFGSSLDGLQRSLDLTMAALDRGAIRHRALTRLGKTQREGAIDLIHRLQQAFEPMSSLRGRSSRAKQPPLLPLASLARAHHAVAEALAADESGATGDLWSGTAGAALHSLLQTLSGASLPGPDVAYAEYAGLYRSLIRREVVRPSQPAHPRLAIWGPLEARLLTPDLVILGGLNEGTWPETADPGPWLNRAMRAELGLETPEQRIGLAAHDFTQLLGAREVVLTRALKSGGAPTTPSRWLSRMNALLSGLELDQGQCPVLAPNQPWLPWALARHHSLPVRRAAEAPAPRPPVPARPRRLPVTAVETWLANPYAIFARHILGLEPLPGLAEGLSASDRGQIIHEALAQFCLRHPSSLPADPAAELVAIAADFMARLGDGAKARAFWRPRFERFSQWFAETEPARRLETVKVLGELRGSLAFEAPAGPFVLTARADRIDLTTDGSLAIYDYKSGPAPKEAAVLSFRSPQLPLEVLIAQEGGFHRLNPNEFFSPDELSSPTTAAVSKLAYVSASGGEPPGEELIVSRMTSAALAEAARLGFSALVALFDKPETPYRALRRPAFESTYRYDAYAHLARAAEWLTSGNGED